MNMSSFAALLRTEPFIRALAALHGFRRAQGSVEAGFQMLPAQSFPSSRLNVMTPRHFARSLEDTEPLAAGSLVGDGTASFGR